MSDTATAVTANPISPGSVSGAAPVEEQIHGPHAWGTQATRNRSSSLSVLDPTPSSTKPATSATLLSRQRYRPMALRYQSPRTPAAKAGPSRHRATGQSSSPEMVTLTTPTRSAMSGAAGSRTYDSPSFPLPGTVSQAIAGIESSRPLESPRHQATYPMYHSSGSTSLRPNSDLSDSLIQRPSTESATTTMSSTAGIAGSGTSLPAETPSNALSLPEAQSLTSQGNMASGAVTSPVQELRPTPLAQTRMSRISDNIDALLLQPDSASPRPNEAGGLRSRSGSSCTLRPQESTTPRPSAQNSSHQVASFSIAEPLVARATSHQPPQASSADNNRRGRSTKRHSLFSRSTAGPIIPQSGSDSISAELSGESATPAEDLHRRRGRSRSITSFRRSLSTGLRSVVDKIDPDLPKVHRAFGTHLPSSASVPQGPAAGCPTRANSTNIEIPRTQAWDEKVDEHLAIPVVSNEDPVVAHLMSPRSYRSTRYKSSSGRRCAPPSRSSGYAQLPTNMPNTERLYNLRRKNRSEVSDANVSLTFRFNGS